MEEPESMLLNISLKCSSRMVNLGDLELAQGSCLSMVLAGETALPVDVITSQLVCFWSH